MSSVNRHLAMSSNFWAKWSSELSKILSRKEGTPCDPEMSEVLEPEKAETTTTVEGREAELDVLEQEVRKDGFRDPELLYFYVQTLGEKVKELSARAAESETQDDGDASVSFGTKKKFGTLGHMKNYFYDVCRQLFEIDPANLKYNLGVAQLCLRTLPSWAGNVPFAKLCLDRALLFHPDDPDAIVKMGLYKLRIDRDVFSARNMFERAKLIDDKYFHALVNLLYSTFENMEDYHDRVVGWLKKAMKQEYWKPDQRCVLFFIRGLVQLMEMHYEKNVPISWCLAWECSSSEFRECLTNFSKIKTLYRFPANDSFTLVNFCAVMKSYLDSTDRNEKHGVVKKIRSAIKEIGRMELRASAVSEDSRRMNKKMFGLQYKTLDNVLLGSNTTVGEALKVFGIPENPTKYDVNRKYMSFVADHMKQYKSGEKAVQDICKMRMFRINSAFAALHQFLDRQATEMLQLEQLQQLSTNDKTDDEEGIAVYTVEVV